MAIRRTPSFEALEEPGPCLEAVEPCVEAPEECVSPPVADLAVLGPDERLRVLAAVTARFSAGYLRWMRSRAGDPLAFSGVRVLGLLESGGPAIMRDLADQLALSARNVTAVIDSLEETALVRRVPHPRDRRATVIELTAAGRREALRGRRQAETLAAQVFDALSPEEQQAYAEILVRLTSRFCY